MIALIDADSILYKVGFAIEDKVIWNEPEFLAGIDEEQDIEYSVDLGLCYASFQRTIENIMFAVDADGCELVFTGSHNIRKTFPTEYKENRKLSRKPSGYDEMLEYALANYNCTVADNIEADDIVVYRKTTYPDDYILCAIDKDVLYQTEGIHYNYNKDESVEVSKFESTKYAYLQTLSGDTSDGYKGCKGIGEKKAIKLLDGLETEEEMWEAVVTAYEAKGQTEEDALWTMRLANMHQFDGKDFILWETP